MGENADLLACIPRGELVDAADAAKGSDEQRSSLVTVLAAQPLVVAGDVMVFVVGAPAPGTRRQLVTTRVFNTGAGLRQERLSWVADENAVAVHECDASTSTAAGWAACTRAAVGEGKVVLPSPVRALYEPATGATTLSRWAAHWAENADTDLLGAGAEACAGVSSDGLALALTGTWRPPRVWTLRTARASAMGRASGAAEEGPRLAFVTVPDFAGPETPCGAVVNLRVVALEYINDQNLLLTTEAGSVAAPETGAPPVYRHYYVHPNEHRCADVSAPDDADRPRAHVRARGRGRDVPGARRRAGGARDGDGGRAVPGGGPRAAAGLGGGARRRGGGDRAEDGAGWAPNCAQISQ